MRITIAFLLCQACLFSQSKKVTADVVDALFLDSEYPRVVELSAPEKSEAIRKLATLRHNTNGKELQKVSFLLAALGYNYTTNRDHLVSALRTCGSRNSECDEDTAGFLIGLYHQGHREVLYPIMSASLKSDGALAELLGNFYSEVAESSPADFVLGLRRLDAIHQEAACTLSGGGMSPDTVQKVQRALNGIGGKVATRCLRNIENSSREAGEEQRGGTQF
jgi:hypothetical protein